MFSLAEQGVHRLSLRKCSKIRPDKMLFLRFSSLPNFHKTKIILIEETLPFVKFESSCDVRALAKIRGSELDLLFLAEGF